MQIIIIIPFEGLIDHHHGPIVGQWIHLHYYDGIGWGYFWTPTLKKHTLIRL